MLRLKPLIRSIRYRLLIILNGKTQIPLIVDDLNAIYTKLKDIFQGWPSIHVALRHSIGICCKRSTRLLLLGENEVVLILVMPKSSGNDVMTPPRKAAARSVIKFSKAPFCEQFFRRHSTAVFAV